MNLRVTSLPDLAPLMTLYLQRLILLSDSDAQKTFLPKLTIFVQLQDGVPVSAALSPDTKSQLEDLAARLESTSLDNSPCISPDVAISHDK